MGKELSNIDYDTIEKSIIHNRSISKNQDFKNIIRNVKNGIKDDNKIKNGSIIILIIITITIKILIIITITIKILIIRKIIIIIIILLRKIVFIIVMIRKIIIIINILIKKILMVILKVLIFIN